MKQLLLSALVVFGLSGFAEKTTPPTEPSAEPQRWAHSSELGIALQKGNSDAQTLNAKQETSYTWTQNRIKTSGHFLKSAASGEDTAKNWDIVLRYDRELSETLGAFVGNGWEGDSFSGYEYRANIDVGGKIYLITGDKKDNFLINETGYRFTHEQRVPQAATRYSNDHYGRIYFEGRKALTESVFARAWIEFLPDLGESKNLMINFEPSLNVVLSKYFSLKLALLGKYDGQPSVVGNKTLDYLYTTSLVANY